MKAQTFTDIFKFNPYHDSRGRFSSADGATSFTYAPGKSKAHDMAIAREKERHAAAAGAGGASEQQNKYSEEEQVEAIKSWTLGDYFDIRKIQCGKKPGYLSEEQQTILTQKGEAIEEYINSKESYEGEIYRGINTNSPMDFQKGQIIDMRGTSSWTADPYLADEFAGVHETYYPSYDTAYVFQMKKAPKRSADINDISENYGELEVIVSKNVNFKITGIEKTEKRTLITVEEA